MKFDFDFSLTRRQLLKILGSGALFLLGSKSRRIIAKDIALNVQPTSTKLAKSRVVLCRHKEVLDPQGQVRPKIIRLMLDQSIKKLANKKDLKPAWRQFVLPTDVIGLKVNSMSYPTTHTELAYAVADSLIENGVTANNVIIWDQIWENLKRAGYKINQSPQGVRCYASNSYGKILVKKFRSLQYDSEPVSCGVAKSNLSKIFSKHCTAIINMPILKDHNIAGITNSMKNLLGGINNPEDYHPNHGDPYLADLNGIPQINKKLKLNIVDVLTPLYQGGPSGHPSRQWQYHGIMLSTDRVALDYLGWQLIEEKRKEMKLKPLEAEGRKPSYILTAAQKGLGNAELENIELIELNLT